MEKYKIEKGSVMETLIIPLYGKKEATKMYPDLFKDTDCVELFERVDVEIPHMSNFKRKLGAIMAGTRQFDLVSACKTYIKTHEDATVLNLGCGLDTSFSFLKNGRLKGINIDFPDVIKVRNELLPGRKDELNIASDLNDLTWIEKVDFETEKGLVAFASGVFYYFKKEEVKAIVAAMAEAFPGGKLVFDSTNAKGLKKMLKTWAKGTEMVDVATYFSLEDEQEIMAWSDKIARVTKRGYMTGYRPLDKAYGFFANLLFKYVDKKNLSQIIEIEFKK